MPDLAVPLLVTKLTAVYSSVGPVKVTVNTALVVPDVGRMMFGTLLTTSVGLALVLVIVPVPCSSAIKALTGLLRSTV